MKTSELIGPALDWAVAKCEGLKECMVFGRGTVKDTGFAVPNKRGGYEPVLLKCVHDKWFKQCDGYPWGSGQVIWQPSTDWSQGGLIIEKEKIAIDWDYDCWNASTANWPAYYSASTPLIAAMRCYVASKLGYTVEIPEELS